jgi:hypothetical protein
MVVLPLTLTPAMEVLVVVALRVMVLRVLETLEVRAQTPPILPARQDRVLQMVRKSKSQKRLITAMTVMIPVGETGTMTKIGQTLKIPMAQETLGPVVKTSKMS